MEHIVIIGNGISGVTAARHIRKNTTKKITIVSSEHPYFFSRTALMYVYMGHLKFSQTQPYEKGFWNKNNINLKEGHVTAVAPATKTLTFKDNSTLTYDTLIIATGSKPNKFGWPGQDLKGVLGMYHKQDLEQLEQWAPNPKQCKRAVIVGGGLIGIELAEMLRSRNIPVTFLVRETSFWNGVLPAQESEMLNKHIAAHHIDLRLASNLKEIKSDKNGGVTSVVIEETGEEIACNVVGLTAGVTPNIDFLEGSGIETKKGVLVNRFLATNVKDVYAIGDCAEQRESIGLRRNIETVWYTGRMMGETVAQTICGNPTQYSPGHWFNSAKFLDIEYQTYGWVFSERHKKPYEAYFQWKHPKKNCCITISYHKDSMTFLGINTFGIRMRHEKFDQWLTEKQSIHYVLKHLKSANFDPEFYDIYEHEIVAQFNAKHQTKIKIAPKSWKRIFSKKLQSH